MGRHRNFYYFIYFKYRIAIYNLLLKHISEIGLKLLNRRVFFLEFIRYIDINVMYDRKFFLVKDFDM